MQREDLKTDDVFNRVLGKKNIAVLCLMEDKQTGTRFIIANTHIYWDPAYCDVKLVQVALLVDEIEKIAHNFAKYPPTPSPANVSGSTPNQLSAPRPRPVYTDGTNIPLIICGDFNSLPSSGVYDFLSNGTLPANHPDFMSHTYGKYTSEGLRHQLGLKSAYATPGAGELLLTTYTPSFQGVIDYVWYSTANLKVRAVLGEVDREYLGKVVGFPNAHFPSEYVVFSLMLCVYWLIGFCLQSHIYHQRVPREATERTNPLTTTSLFIGYYCIHSYIHHFSFLSLLFLSSYMHLHRVYSLPVYVLEFFHTCT